MNEEEHFSAMNIEHCLESCWLPVEPSKAGGALKERIVQIQMEYWSFITNDDVQVYQSMWIVHNPLVDIKCAFDITGDEK